MAIPNRPDYDRVIDDEWGQWVHDELVMRGVKAYAETTANQTGIASGADTDLTGLTVTFTAIAGRVYRVTCAVTFQSTAAGGIMLGVKEGAGYHQTASAYAGAVNAGITAVALRIHRGTLAAGAHTIRAMCFVGAGTGQANAGAATPNFLMVEDIGPSS